MASLLFISRHSNKLSAMVSEISRIKVMACFSSEYDGKEKYVTLLNYYYIFKI
jgi:hypothetical protein